MSQVAIFSAQSGSLLDTVDPFFSVHDHREHRRQTKAQSLSIPLLCIVVQRQGCALFSSLTQACSLFVKGAEVHPNLFSDADSC